MPEVDEWRPDKLTRQSASTIRPNDVECLKFGGIYMGGFIGYDPIIVYDRRLIRLFISALQEAVVPAFTNKQLVMNRANQMMVCFRRNKTGKPIRGPLFFYFKPDDPNSSFGPAFVQALRELSRYQADRVRQRVRQLSSQVVVVKVGDKAIRHQSTVRELLAELQQLDEKAFTYTEPSDSLPVTLVAKNGKEWRITLMVSGSAVQATHERRNPPPLPPTLWRLFEKVTTGD